MDAPLPHTSEGLLNNSFVTDSDVTDDSFITVSCAAVAEGEAAMKEESAPLAQKQRRESQRLSSENRRWIRDAEKAGRRAVEAEELSLRRMSAKGQKKEWATIVASESKKKKSATRERKTAGTTASSRGLKRRDLLVNDGVVNVDDDAVAASFGVVSPSDDAVPSVVGTSCAAASAEPLSSDTLPPVAASTLLMYADEVSSEGETADADAGSASKGGEEESGDSVLVPIVASSEPSATQSQSRRARPPFQSKALRDSRGSNIHIAIVSATDDQDVASSSSSPSSLTPCGAGGFGGASARHLVRSVASTSTAIAHLPCSPTPSTAPADMRTLTLTPSASSKRSLVKAFETEEKTARRAVASEWDGVRREVRRAAASDAKAITKDKNRAPSVSLRGKDAAADPGADMRREDRRKEKRDKKSDGAAITEKDRPSQEGEPTVGESANDENRIKNKAPNSAVAQADHCNEKTRLDAVSSERTRAVSDATTIVGGPTEKKSVAARVCGVAALYAPIFRGVALYVAAGVVVSALRRAASNSSTRGVA